MKSNLRIAINAQLPLGSGSGGVETVLRTLAFLGQMDDGDEEYVFIGHWADADWLKPFASGRLKIIQAPPPEEYKSIVPERFKRSLGALRPLARKIKHVFAPPQTQISVPVSDGFYENLNCGVVHFPYQDYVLCDVPTVYNPHDLQHLHYPKFFTGEEIARRETIYPAACRAARAVAVASEFVKRDVMENYGIEADKIQVIEWAPPEINSDKIGRQLKRSVADKYNISAAPFALYPAMTWEHKNHIRLLEAIALLRERRNLHINLICTGDKNSFFPQIERRLRELNLEEQVKFLGIVSHEELSALYLLSQFVVVPTLFEAASAPLFEAWQHNAPAACSSVTSLPEQASGAALLFDPFSVEAIADAVGRMSSDAALRTELRAKGAARLLDFSIERTAKSYRAVYRKIAGLKLNDEDRDLLGRKTTREKISSDWDNPSRRRSKSF